MQLPSSAMMAESWPPPPELDQLRCGSVKKLPPAALSERKRVRRARMAWRRAADTDDRLAATGVSHRINAVGSLSGASGELLPSGVGQDACRRSCGAAGCMPWRNGATSSSQAPTGWWGRVCRGRQCLSPTSCRHGRPSKPLWVSSTRRNAPLCCTGRGTVSLLLAADAPPSVIIAIVGHATFASVCPYSHTDMAVAREALAKVPDRHGLERESGACKTPPTSMADDVCYWRDQLITETDVTLRVAVFMASCLSEVISWNAFC